MRVVRFVTAPVSSNSSVVTVSRCSPRPIRAISPSHSNSLTASAFFIVLENSEYGDGARGDRSSKRLARWSWSLLDGERVRVPRWLREFVRLVERHTAVAGPRLAVVEQAAGDLGRYAFPGTACT